MPFDTSALGLGLSVVLFCGCALAIALAGARLARVVDDLADRTGLGEAIAGAVMMGAATSLSGIVLSVTAALRERPELAVSNALGGIAVQTVFLAVADLTYRRANLEHAAASVANLAQCALLVGLMGVVLVGTYSPEVTVLGVHPATPLLLAAYLSGLVLVRSIHALPMWSPARTRETRVDRPKSAAEAPALSRLTVEFLLLALVLGVAGWLTEGAANNIGRATGLSQTAVGVLLASVATSLPELVTTVAAVRRRALQLAVGGIIGGNVFDCLFVAASDVGYRGGSIYHAIPDRTLLWVALVIVMTVVLLLGLIRRQRSGLANIGFESVTLPLIYAGGIALAMTL